MHGWIIIDLRQSFVRFQRGIFCRRLKGAAAAAASNCRGERESDRQKRYQMGRLKCSEMSLSRQLPRIGTRNQFLNEYG